MRFIGPSPSENHWLGPLDGGDDCVHLCVEFGGVHKKVLQKRSSGIWSASGTDSLAWIAHFPMTFVKSSQVDKNAQGPPFEKNF